MALTPPLRERLLTPELMDDPSLDAQRHRRALRGLARLNRAAGAAAILWPPLREMASMPGHPSLRVLDLATGSGDLPRALMERARSAGLAVTVDGCDVSEVAIAEAQRRAAGLNFFRADVLSGSLPAGYDVIMCSLFMHHLERGAAVDLLYRMRCAASRMVLVSDLERSAGGYVLAGLASRVLSRSAVVHADALKSVRAAFTADEFGAMASEAGLHGALIERCRPCRFRLVWRRGDAQAMNNADR